jgi:hypothetical protein
MRQTRSVQADSDIQVTCNTVDIMVDYMVGNRVAGFRRTMNNQELSVWRPVGNARGFGIGAGARDIRKPALGSKLTSGDG